MKIPTVSVVQLNKNNPDREGRSKVYIRITHQRTPKYYPLDIALLPKEFDRIITAKRRTDSEREIFDRIQLAEARAKEVIKELPVFSFGNFEKRFLSERTAVGTVRAAFLDYIALLNSLDRFNTAMNYEAAMISLEGYKKGLKFVDITPRFLQEYERYMLKNGKSITTVGIYLRNLRAIYNREKVDRSIYPFGSDADKYSIPTGKNIKKARSLDDIVKIANYTPKNDMEAFARDFWILSFQCNGMNIKDILHLRRSEINGDMLTFERAKTGRTKVEKEKISVSLKDESKETIKRWGNVIDLNDKDPYIFPVIRKGMTAKENSRAVQQTVKQINKYMKRIAEALEIKGDVRTYAARHSFSQILKKSGVSVEFISDALGHSEFKTTKAYLDSFEDDAIHKQTAILGDLKKQQQ